MRKYYKLIIILIVISSIISHSKKVFGATNLPEYDSNWVNWSTHNYGEGYPLVEYGYYANNTDRPWYNLLLVDSSKGIVIKYNRGNNQLPVYYYLSYENTATITIKNIIANSSTNQSMTLWNGNSVIIDGNFNNLFHLANEVYVYSFTPSYAVNVDHYDVECTSSQDLYDQLGENNWQNPDIHNPIVGNMPYFYLKVVGPAGNHNTFAGDVEYTLTWDTRNSFISDPSDYYISVYVWSGNEEDFFTNWSHKKAINNTDNNPYNMGMTAFTWTFVDMERLWLINNWAQHHFHIAVRIVTAEGTPVNEKWGTFTVTKMYEITSASIIQDNDGAPTGQVTPLGQRVDGIFQYTDGRPTGDNTNADGTQNSNGSSVSPTASEEGINNYEPTYTYGNYNFGGSLQDLEQTLTSLVKTVGVFPQLLSQVCTFFPSWLISLIGVGIGLLVIIGVIKTINN